MSVAAMDIKCQPHLDPTLLPVTLTCLQALVEPTGHALLPGVDGHPALLVQLVAGQAGVVTTLHTSPEESTTGLTANTTIVGMAPSLQY